MKIDDILQIEDIGDKIDLLKKGRKTPLPDADKLLRDWNPNFHEIMTDLEKYPKIKVVTEPEKVVYDSNGNPHVIAAKTEYKEPNRIVLPLEQDIVNIHTAFTVGTEPNVDCSPTTENEKAVLSALKHIGKKSKIKYQNRKVVRSWLSEQECAEYWYTVKDDSFWAKLKSKIDGIFGKESPKYRLKSAIWSPFRGDKLYPFFDEYGDLVAFSREYKKKDGEGKEVTSFTTITAKSVYRWEDLDGWKLVEFFSHGFSKIPVVYCYRSEALCEKIKTIRVRLEKLLSNYADCIDYHFFPILKLFGSVERFSGDSRNRIVELTGEGADAAYLTWNQNSDPIRVEFEKHFEQAYSLTNTPRISFENLKGMGNAVSGVAFRYVFMGAHMAVENHGEVIGDFMQRRANFLVSAIGDINPSLRNASETIDIDVNLVPYMIDNIDDKVMTAVKAISGGVWSRREGIIFAGNIDRLDEELKEIEEDLNKRDNTRVKQLSE